MDSMDSRPMGTKKKNPVVQILVPTVPAFLRGPGHDLSLVLNVKHTPAI